MEVCGVVGGDEVVLFVVNLYCMYLCFVEF